MKKILLLFVITFSLLLNTTFAQVSDTNTWAKNVVVKSVLVDDYSFNNGFSVYPNLYNTSAIVMPINKPGMLIVYHNTFLKKEMNSLPFFLNVYNYKPRIIYQDVIPYEFILAM